MKNRPRLIVAVAAALALAACGGDTQSPQPTGLSGNPAVVGQPLSEAQQRAGFIGLTPHIIVDRQGWGQPVEAYRILVPSGWQVRSDVVWYGPQGPCGVGSAQPVYVATSPDGRMAIEYASAMALSDTNFEVNWQAVPEISRQLVQIQVQEQQRLREQMAQQLAAAGDGCRAGTVNGALEFAQRFIQPLRRPNSRIVASRPAQQTQAGLQATMQQMTAGAPSSAQAQHYTDAVTVDLEGPGPDGQPTAERMAVGVIATRYLLPGLDIGGGGPATQSSFDSISTLPIVSVRAPRDQFARAEQIAATVVSSMTVNPAYQAAMDRMQEQLIMIRAQQGRQALMAIAQRGQIMAEARAQANDQQLRGWYAGQETRQRAHDAFIDRIYDSNGFVNPETGARVRAPYGQTAFSNGQGGVAIGPEGSNPGNGWTAMQAAPTG